jgi:putative porin
MLRRFILMLTVAWTITLFSLAAAWGEEMPADNGRAEVIGALADLFRDKEAITGDEAAALKEKIKPPMPAGKDLEELLALLQKKGVIGEEESAEIINRIRSSSIPGGDIEALVDSLRVQGTVTSEEADGIMDKLRATPLGKEKEQYERIMANVAREIRKEVQGMMKKEIKEEAIKEAKAETRKSLPEWLNRIRFGGDLRFRYEGAFFDQNNADILKPDKPAELMNTKVDRHRFLLRARLDMTAQVNDEVDATIGLATGTASNPVSTNVTLGDFFSKKPFNVDLAYMKWTPLPSLTLWSGRIPSPWFSTDLVWDPDLRFDGIAGSYATQFTPRLSGFATIGAFPLQEVEFSTRDKWLFGGQAVVSYQPRQNVNVKLGVAFYDFENITGRANDPAIPGENDFTAPLFQQKGNTLFDIDPSSAIKTALASDFREINVTGMLDLGYWDPVHLVFLGDYVKNLGYKRVDVVQRTGNSDIEEETTGYQLGFAVGYPNIRDYGDWKGYFFYKHLGADAAVDAFTDSDFHLGGTNAKGWIVGGDVGLRKNFWLSARWLTADEISGPPIAVDVFQLNLNAKF